MRAHTCIHTCVFTLYAAACTHSHKNCTYKVPMVHTDTAVYSPPTFRHIHTHKPNNNQTQTHTFSHTGCAQGKKGSELLGWIGSGWGRSGLVLLISTRLILTVLTLTQAIHHVISPRWSVCVSICHCVCVCVCTQVV